MNIRIRIVVFILFSYFQSQAQSIGTENVVGTSFIIQSEMMSDKREIQVFLPDSYSTSNLKYPVLYILDGQRYFLHGVSLQKSFVEFRQSPEFIVVGISKNISDRNRNFSSNSKNYLEFIKKEVVSFVDTRFRTSKKRLLFGWAYGGGFVLETMINEPDLFETYIAASPFPLKEKINRIDSLFQITPNFDKLLFFTSGTDEGIVKEGTRELNAILTNMAPTINWTFKELKGEEHRSTPFSTLYHGIKKSFEYYPELQFSDLEEFTKAGGLDHVYDYYQKRASRYEFAEDLSDWTMFSITRNAVRANDYKQFDILVNEFEKTGFIERLRVSRACLIADFYLQNKQYNRAIKLFKLIAEKYPNSDRPLNGLGKAYNELGKRNVAKRFYAKAKKISQKSSN